MKEIHHGYGLYLKLKETLDAEQTALLVKLSDQHLSDEENAYTKGISDGRLQGLKTAVKLILGAIGSD